MELALPMREEIIKAPLLTLSSTSEVEPAPHFEAMVFLGKNWQRRFRFTNNRLHFDPFRASIETRIAALAAGLAYELGLTDRIVFAGGCTGPTSEAELMRKRIRSLFPEIPDEAIILEDRSLDTTENARYIKELFEREGINPQRAALATIGAHTTRAEDIFRREGMEFAQTFSTELMLRDNLDTPHSRLIQPIIDKYLRSGRVGLEKLREGVLRKILRIDKEGGFPRLLAHLFRKHTQVQTPGQEKIESTNQKD